MAWYSKEQPTPFDDAQLEGLFFLDGDVLAVALGQFWTKGQKYPQIAFPSGITRDLWESSSNEAGIVHLFGEMDLLLKDHRDGAYTQAMSIAEVVGYDVQKRGDAQLEIRGQDTDEHFLITYDNQRQVMTDVVRVKTVREQTPPRMPLLTEALRAQLPNLYSNEALGLEAKVLVKFFTPSSNWTWYASEFDGEDIFFGLVIGYEIELGYFALSELEAVGGGLILPVERDRFYEPKTLRELEEQHRQARDRH